MLRDLRPGATLFVLDKKEGKIGKAVVANVVPTMPFNAYLQPTQIVAVAFKYEGRDITIDNVNATAASADDSRGSGLVICESNEALISEVKSYVAYNEDMASKKSYFEDRAKWGNSVLLEIDPAQKVKAEYETQLRTMMSKYDEMFNKMKAENDELRSRLDSRDTKKGKE